MSRLSFLLILAGLLAGAFAQTTTTEAMNETTTEETPTEGPTLPPVPIPGNYSYSPDGGPTCLQLIANMTVEIGYNNETEMVPPMEFNLTDIAQLHPGNTSCGEKDSQLGVFFDTFGEDTPQFITFKFQKDNTNVNVWNAMEVIYSFNTENFPADVNITGFFNLEAGKLFNQSLNVGASYSCTQNTVYVFNSSSVGGQVTARLNVADLQVQAFYDPKKELYGVFGSATDCAASKGNKIVPIAVGAALAGLVIVVLIAYLIGRLKSRRQNSYEALS